MLQEFSVDKNRVMIRLLGSMQAPYTDQLREILLQLAYSKHKVFIVDLSNVTDIDASGLCALVEMTKNIEQNGGRLMLKGNRGKTRLLFDKKSYSMAFELI